MIELGRSITPELLPTPERDTSLPEIIYFPNPRTPRAMDIVVKQKTQQQLYEDTCFEYLRDTLPNVFLLGPHYIDWALGKSRMSGEGRMDAIGVVPSENGVALRLIAEFKSGKANGILKKMKGISYTLDRFRENPQMLQEILNSLEPNIIFPNIYIPSDSNIQFRFISPHRKQTVTEPLPFDVHFEEVAPMGSPIPVTLFAVA